MKTMKRTITLLAALALSAAAFAQPGQRPEPLPGKGMVSNINVNSYPRILEDNSVLFGIRAPKARTVQIDIMGRKYDLTEGQNGFWTGKTDPLIAGFHYYAVVIDGISFSDPASHTYFGCSRDYSAVDIPEEGCDYLETKDVPHGAVRTMTYWSKQAEEWKPLCVYTPASYEKGKKKYPVLYIQHGGGEDYTGWAVQGRTRDILDNLIADGKAVEMIVVMADGTVRSSVPGAGGYNAKGMEPFSRELIENVIPYVESTFRVFTDSRHRALSGLSMGGGQTFYCGLANLDKFDYLGVFSSGLFGGIAQSTNVDLEKEMPGLLSQSGRFNDGLRLFYISVGTDDPRVKGTTDCVDTMRKNGLKVTFETFPGDHEWQVWRKSLHSFAQKLFK